MTIPKNAGLSHLADVSNEQALTFHYPIKKKGQPRRLRPNLDAIRYLEIEAETDTEIHSDYTPEWGWDTSEAFRVQRAMGFYSARQANMYPWPMFQCFPAVSFKANMIGYLEPCPDCDDWSRTSKCTEHHDRDGVAGLKMGDERRRARQRERERAAGRRVVNAYASPERATSMAEYFRQVIDNSEARYTPNDGRRYFTWAEQQDERDRQMREQARLYAQTPCTCSMCTGRTQDPNEGRPGYHYNLASDRWERDTPDALGDFRAGGFQMPDELLQFSAVPDELRPTPRRVQGYWPLDEPSTADLRRCQDALRDLPDGSITINNATIEVNGETVQGIQSFTIHIEGDADGT